jgi:repressor LexA
VVDYNLKALERQGFIRRDREVSRAIEVLQRGGRRPRTLAIPIIGRIAAGQPIPVPSSDSWSSADYDDVIEVTRDMIGGRDDVYGVRVQGSSMIDALVNDGDIVLMQAANSADNGDMVAAWLKREQEATLKHFPRGSASASAGHRPWRRSTPTPPRDPGEGCPT